MRYRSIEDLPFVCRYNLPEAALRVYRDAYNRAWEESSLAERDRVALHRAWEAVRECFEKEELTGRWMPRAGEPAVPAAVVGRLARRQ